MSAYTMENKKGKNKKFLPDHADKSSWPVASKQCDFITEKIEGGMSSAEAFAEWNKLIDGATQTERQDNANNKAFDKLIAGSSEAQSLVGLIDIGAMVW